jgi:hypothetical protein
MGIRRTRPYWATATIPGLLGALLPLLGACQLTSADEVDRSSTVSRGSGGSPGHDVGTSDWANWDSADSAQSEDAANDVPMVDQAFRSDSLGLEPANIVTVYDLAADRFTADENPSIDLVSIDLVGLDLDSQLDADQRSWDGAGPFDQADDAGR